MEITQLNQLIYQNYHHKPYLDGSEANIYISSDNRHLLKKFNKNISLESLENKKNKLLELIKIDNLEDIYPKITSFVYKENQFVGYIMDYYDGYCVDEIMLTFEEKIDFLKNLKQKILKLKSEDIYYFDLHFDNILCHKQRDILDIKLIDIDNIQIDKYGCDVTSFLLDSYLKLGGKIDFNALIYVFNFISYCLLINCYQLEINYLKKYLKENNYFHFLDKKVQTICDDLLNFHIDSLCDHEFLIDFMEYDDYEDKILLK